MDLLIDTQSLLWVAVASSKLSMKARAALDCDAKVFVSAVTAFEYIDLNRRGRFGVDAPLPPIIARLDATILDFPAEAAGIVEDLPLHHLDPVDRMLIAHSIHIDMPVLTADATMRSYPLRTIW